MKPKTAQDNGKTAPDRPSLYSFNSRDRDAGEIFSILDALEPGHRRNALWWRAVLIGLVGLLAAALYVVGKDVDVYRHLSPAAADEAAIGRTVVRQEVQEPTPAAPLAPTAESSAAAIDVDPPLHNTEPQASEPAEKHKAEDAQSAIALADPGSKRSEGAENAPAAPVASPDSKSVVNENDSARPAFKEKTAPSARKQEKKPASHPPAMAKPAAAPGTGKDSDVDLIAALVTHVSRGESSGKEIKKKNVKTTAESRATGVSSKRERRNDASRDIVVRNDGDSTEALVTRCRALGLIEGELCRLRICSGLWGTDPACPGTAPGDQQSLSGR